MRKSARKVNCIKVGGSWGINGVISIIVIRQ